ncbi:MAG TPA: M20/M25/M40 family metallo-hydrolase [Gaiellaceae bacterium]|nr:M20/M25/M40 family metallo-hydrolase [Gaiellaceae bacterium]
MDEIWQRELAEFIRIPSVSAEAAHREDVKEAGEWVCAFIRAKCGGSATLTPFGEKELALGEIRASNDAANAPTVLVYNHFDVQPPSPLDLWKSDPFELTIRDDWAYGRGVADDKGQLYIMLKAAQKLVESSALAVNLRFACDGEEEIGGTTVVDWIRNDDVGADAGVIFDGGMVRIDAPAFSLSTRGLIAFEVKVTTGDRDLHSGMYGGAALNAIHVLMRVLNAVTAENNGLLAETLRKGIIPPTADELENWKALPHGADELGQQGARPLDARAAEEFYVRTWAEPAADVNGILGGNPGLRNTTLSVQAAGEISVRLAPGQDVDTIGGAVEKLMREAAPAGATVDIRWAGVPAGRMRPEAPAIQLGLTAFEKVLGVRPLLVRSGGTLPIVPALADVGIPTVFTGFALPESGVHSPNEKFLVRYFDAGVNTAAQLFMEYAALPTS